MKIPIITDLHMKNGKRAEFDLYIGRQMNYPPKTVFPRSKWYNPFTFNQDGEAALLMYEIYITSLLKREFPENHPRYFELQPIPRDRILRAVRRAFKTWETWNLDELEGKILGCWCTVSQDFRNPVCHGHVLIKLFKIKHRAPGNCEHCGSDMVEDLQQIDPGVMIMLCLDCQNTFIVDDKEK